MKHFIVISLLCIYHISFGQKEQLAGYWLFSPSEGDTIILKKATHFNEDAGGYYFDVNGNMLCRQNSGWCGTPPISYKNFDGTWSITEKSIVLLDYDFWGGSIIRTWKILSVDESTMKVVELTFKTHRGDDY